jgi:hypothetical protein
LYSTEHAAIERLKQVGAICRDEVEFDAELFSQIFGFLASMSGVSVEQEVYHKNPWMVLPEQDQILVESHHRHLYTFAASDIMQTDIVNLDSLDPNGLPLTEKEKW